MDKVQTLNLGNITCLKPDLFPSSGEEKETPNVLAPLERASLNPDEFWTMDKVQTLDLGNTTCLKPDLFPASGEKETPTVLAALEIASLNSDEFWTLDKVQTPNDSERKNWIYERLNLTSKCLNKTHRLVICI
jgi:hypothetical protein